MKDRLFDSLWEYEFIRLAASGFERSGWCVQVDSTVLKRHRGAYDNKAVTH